MTQILNISNKSNDNSGKLAIKNNIYKLTHESSLVREKARELLVGLGSQAIDYLIQFINHPSKTARWEAVKALSEINDPVAAPFLVNALEDESSDVRWLAAEGLVAMGTYGIRAVFDALLVEPDSLFLRKGTHHVLSGIADKYADPDFKQFQHILDAPDAELKIVLRGKPHLRKIIQKIREYES